MKYTTLPPRFDINTINQEISRTIQERLFQFGLRWQNEKTSYIQHGSQPWLTIGYNGNPQIITHDSSSSAEVVLTVEELFAIPVVPVAAPKVIHILPWEVAIDASTVKVGCQKIDRSKFDSLLAEIAEFRKFETPILSKPWYIETFNSEVSEVIQQKLVSLGWKWEAGNEEVDPQVKGFIHSDCEDMNEKLMDGFWNNDSREEDEEELKDHRKITIAELFGADEKFLSLESLSFVLTNRGIRADSKTVSWETFDKFLAAI